MVTGRRGAAVSARFAADVNGALRRAEFDLVGHLIGA